MTSDVRFIHADDAARAQSIARAAFEAQLEGSGLMLTPEATARWWPLTV
jgi:hypothetical protein